MAKVTFIGFSGGANTVDVPVGTTLVRAATDNGVPGIDGDCGGNCACATACRAIRSKRHRSGVHLLVHSGTVFHRIHLSLRANHQRRINMDHQQLIQAAASIAGGMAAAHYDKFSGLVATRINDIAETAVKIARAIDAEARKQP
jgi:uncharacterized 2Fe-2S/4Fe-4S cluster protein (DUF4445 family)